MTGNQDVSENPEGSTCDDLQAAEALLRRAEADLTAAQAAEHSAEHEVEEAVREIREAEHHDREIHFTLDGEKYETCLREATPNQSIVDFGKQDPATNYLVEIQGTHKISYQGKGDVEIKLRDCMNFQIISTGPKPVSACTGVVAFAEGLRALGYEPVTLRGLPDHVVFNYLVEIGRFVGNSVRLGFIVPPDFPNIPPAGPHVSPHIQPVHPANDKPHPIGGVHQTQSAAFQREASGEWQYWSRPFVKWGESKKTVTAYMAHIWRLWETQ
jgi:hypothetical protein